MILVLMLTSCCSAAEDLQTQYKHNMLIDEQLENALRERGLITDQTNEELKPIIIQEMQVISPEKRAAIANATKALVERYNISKVAMVIGTLDVVAGDLDDYIQFILDGAGGLIRGNMSGDEVDFIMGVFDRVPQAERQGLADATRILIRDNMDGFEISVIASKLGQFLAAERQEVAEITRQIIGENHQRLRANEIRGILEFFRDEEQRRTYVAAAPFVRPEMDGSGIENLLRTFMTIRPERRAYVSALVERLIQRGHTEEIDRLIHLAEWHINWNALPAQWEEPPAEAMDPQAGNVQRTAEEAEQRMQAFEQQWREAHSVHGLDYEFEDAIGAALQAFQGDHANFDEVFRYLTEEKGFSAAQVVGALKNIYLIPDFDT